MKLKSLALGILAILAVLTFETQVFASASGGFRLPTADAEAMGKAGAFVGEADNASAVYYNPAGMTQLDGENFSLGFAWINIYVDHMSTTGNNTQMQQNNIKIPHMYYVSDLNTDQLALGFAVKSNYGASTEWADDSFARYVSTSTDVRNIDFLLNGAYKLNDQWSVGAGLNITDSKFHQAKNVFQAAGDATAQLKFNDHGYSYNLSSLYKLNEKHQVGLQYRSRTQMNYEGEVTANGLTGALAGLFGGSSYATRIQFDTALPQSAVIGYSFRPTEKWIFNLDAEWTDWSSIRQENVIFPDEGVVARQNALNGLADLNLDWKSAWAYSIGAEYSLSEKLRLRTGYFFHETPIPNANFNTFLPDANSHGVNLGAGYSLNDSMDLDLAWSGVFFEDRNVAATTHNSANSSILGNYEEYINSVMLTFNWKFGK